MAKVIFLHLSVIHSVHWGWGGGGSASVHAGIPNPPQDQPDPPVPGRHPPGPGRHPPGPSRHPPGPGRHPPGPGRHPPRTRQTPPPPGNRLRHTVYERLVRILLECILVFAIICNKMYIFCRNYLTHTDLCLFFVSFRNRIINIG